MSSRSMLGDDALHRLSLWGELEVGIQKSGAYST